MKKSAPRVLAGFFRQGELLLGHAGAVLVKDLVAAAQGRVVALVGALALEVLHLGVEQYFLAGVKLVLLEGLVHPVAGNLRAERQRANAERGQFAQLGGGFAQVHGGFGGPAGGIGVSLGVEAYGQGVKLLGPEVLLPGRNAGYRTHRIFAAAIQQVKHPQRGMTADLFGTGRQGFVFFFQRIDGRGQMPLPIVVVDLGRRCGMQRLTHRFVQPEELSTYLEAFVGPASAMR